MLTAAFMASQTHFRPEFPVPTYAEHSEVQPIDAPNLIASGSHEYVPFIYHEGGMPLPTTINRGES